LQLPRILFSREAPELLSNNTLSNALSTNILLSGASKAGPKNDLSFRCLIWNCHLWSYRWKRTWSDSLPHHSEML
jgi:hypothetical protein